VAIIDAADLAASAPLLELHAAELPQKDELCGAFWVTLALRRAGHLEHEGEPIDQDAVALAAASVLSPGGSRDLLPAGEEGRSDFRLELPREDGDSSGTSAGGLVRAVERLSGGGLAAVPVAGPWSAAAVDDVLDAAACSPAPVTLVANVATGELWGSHATAAQLAGYLESGEDGDGPPSDWSVGHFVGLVARLRGPRGTLVVVGDTYRSLGLGGVHLQPVERVAAALQRDRFPGDGGVLAIVAAPAAPALGDRFAVSGRRIAVWDNGTSDRGADGRT
jgi:hypothetical protein